VSANPMSGSAIHLTNAAKRDEQKRRNPLCQACDLATIAQVGALLGLDVSTVGIVYHEIQASPDELRNEREGDEWSVENGYASQVDVMMRRNPGMTRPQAIAELKRIRADEAALEAEEEEDERKEEIAEGETYGHDFGEGIDDNEAKIIEATVSIVEKAAKGDIPAAGAKAILVEFYRLPPELADRLLGTAPSTEPVPGPVVVEPVVETEAGAVMVDPATEEIIPPSAQALNGAQAQFVIDAVGAVTAGTMPKSAAIEAVKIALPTVDPATIDRMFVDVVPGSAVAIESGPVTE